MLNTVANQYKYKIRKMSIPVDLSDSSEQSSSLVEQVQEGNGNKIQIPPQSVVSFPQQHMFRNPQFPFHQEMPSDFRNKLYEQLNERLQLLLKAATREDVKMEEIRDVVGRAVIFSLRQLIQCRYTNKLNFVCQKLTEHSQIQMVKSELSRVMHMTQSFLNNTNKYAVMKNNINKMMNC